MLELPIYFISDNHFSMEKADTEQIRRIKLFSFFDIIEPTQLMNNFDVLHTSCNGFHD